MTAGNPTGDLSRTICAIATPLGRGALGIVRLAGPEAIQIADRVFRASDHRPLGDHAGFTVHHGFFVDPQSGVSIDEVLATIFRAPKSFTGDDLVEFTVHGGPTVLRKTVDILTASGAELAAPGEFTLRAFLNGRIDLTEAEAVADLISAKTAVAAGAALEVLQGRLRDEVVALRAELVGALARLEMGIDFTEEDLDDTELASVESRLTQVSRRIEHLLAGFDRGRILRDGFAVVLAGPPNVGKSTLFNRLAQDERAIVTDIPGTTRDILREYINLEGWPVCLIDTAGMREAADLVERLGVERSEGAIRSADAVVWLIDANLDWPPQRPPAVFAGLPIPWTVAVNKLDLSSDPGRAVAAIAACQATETQPMPSVIGLSAKTGEGMDDLLRAVTRWIDAGAQSDRGEAIAINDRHRTALLRAQESIARSIAAVRDHRPPELAAFDTREAAVALGEIIGETTSEDVLTEIFSSFCIGK